ncbi:dynein axonemal heavy chain 1 [Anopheles darlingi]|uniref:dynein axonemal heavy chain 1 n=1 Tax=Anopheles darlingi TaxID=43151 RepID=UPI0021005BCE|nr:dynein axonemal heavy chain 1 [Anopheles darlingi]
MQDYDDNYGYARYNAFEVGSESEEYELKNLGSYNDTAGDSMTYHKWMKFSTQDRKNDPRSDLHLAAFYDGAWWYGIAKKCDKYQYVCATGRSRIEKASELEPLLIQAGITASTILHSPSNTDTDTELNSNSTFLPLETFDDWEYEWASGMKMGPLLPVEAFALLPAAQHWEKVLVLECNDANNRWKVAKMSGSSNQAASEWIPRIQLYFPCEDPTMFAKRISAAIEARRKAENRIRFLFLCKHIATEEGCYDPDEQLEKRLLRRMTDEVYSIFKRIYQDFHVQLAVGEYLKYAAGSKSLAIECSLPELGKAWRKRLESCCTPLPRGQHGALCDRLRRQTLLCHANAFHGLRLVDHECELVRKLPLFMVPRDKPPLTLGEFQKQNRLQTGRILKYLQNGWIERTTMHLYRWLGRIGPGCYDITVTEWPIYLVSKTRRLIEQVRFRMQDALRDLCLDSTDSYLHHLVNDCQAIQEVDPAFSWDTNLIDSPFEPRRPAPFQLTLEMGPEFAYYSTDPYNFPFLLQLILDEAVRGSHSVHTIEPSLIQSLLFADNLYLSSVGLIDPAIVERRYALVNYYLKAQIPVLAYVTRYNAYQELFHTNAKDFIEEAKAADKTSTEIKEDIEFQIRMRENLEHTVPLHITIGPYSIIVQPLRDALIQKRQELTVGLLRMLTEKLRLKTSGVIAEYNGIIERMCEKPVSIEHIYAIRAFMEGIPEALSRLEDRMRGVLYEYEILEGFWFNLPDADFAQKWAALGYPRTVLRQMTSVREFHETEVDRFRKQQFADEATFAASIEDLNAYIARFTTLYDVAKVSELSVEVRRLWKTLQELIEHGHVMNKRQALFEMPPIGLHNLYDLRDNFRAYRDLWTVAADYLKLEETWIGNPLASVDLEAVHRGLTNAHDRLLVLLVPFRDQPQLLTVVEHFIRTVEAFRPNLDVMELLKCPHLNSIHFSQIAKDTGSKAKLSIDVGYDVFLENGVRGHVDAIRAIVQLAEEQKEARELQAAEEERLRLEREAIQRARDERRRGACKVKVIS